MKGLSKTGFLLLIFLIFPGLSYAQMGWCPMWRDRAPYGDYCPNSQRGWYGAKRAVKSVQEARKILGEYLKGYDVLIDTIREKEWFFEAEIKDKNNTLLDILIVDKRTGRIRSIY
jgi:hypothetical protein